MGPKVAKAGLAMRVAVQIGPSPCCRSSGEEISVIQFIRRALYNAPRARFKIFA